MDIEYKRRFFNLCKSLLTKRITDKELYVLKARIAQPPKTQKQLASEFNVTRGRIGQIEYRAWIKLKWLHDKRVQFLKNA